MHRFALYYPYFNVRDDRWLKAMVLYWPKLAHVLPKGYETTTTGDIQILRDELDFFIDIDPDADAVARVGTAFRELSRHHARDLRAHYYGSAQATGLTPDVQRMIRSNPVFPQLPLRRRRTQQFTPALAEPRGTAAIHASMVAPYTAEALIDEGLAVASTRLRPGARDLSITSDVSKPWDGSDDGPEVYYSHDGSRRARWLTMPQDLVALYSCALAEELAGPRKLELTTDQPGGYVAAASLDADGLAAALLPKRVGSSPAVETGPLQEQIAVMALRMVLPADLDQVPMRNIIEIRERYGEDFRAFRETAAQTAADLAQDLPDVHDPELLRHLLDDTVKQRFGQPTRNLKKQLRGMKIEATTMTAAVKVALPPVLLEAGGWAAHHPAIATSGAVAYSLFALRRGVTQRRDAVLAPSAASYLVHIDGRLGPRTVLQRTGRRLERIAGTAT